MKLLLIIVETYSPALHSAGRYKEDIPTLPNDSRVIDIIEFLDQELAHLSTTSSPFAFNSRQYESTFRYASSRETYYSLAITVYLPRIDLISINRLGSR